MRRSICLLGLLLAGSASANVGETFGFGSRTIALGGAGVAWGFNGYAAYANPGGLALTTEEDAKRRALFSWGLIYMNPQFTPISNVVTQNQFNSDVQPGSPDVYGDVDTGYKPTFGQQIGLAYRLFPDFGNLTLGLVAFLPLSQVAYMDTGEAYLPEYFLYRARTQRPQFELGVGGKFSNGLHVGAGVHFGFSLTSSGTVFLNNAHNTASSMRFTSSLQPKASPYLGILFAPVDNPKAYSLGAVFRLSLTSDNTMALNSTAALIGNLAGADFNFTAASALFYDPTTIEVGGSWQHWPNARLYGQLDYQLWSAFQAPALLIQQPTTSPGLTIAPGQVPLFQYVNILVPRVGEEIQLTDQVALRVGYSYRASILKDLSTGPGNYLDPPKHSMNIGVGLKYASFLGYDIPCQLDFNLAYQILVAQHIVKTPGNEAGVSGDSKIGSPSYDAGGKQYGGGVTLSLAL